MSRSPRRSTVALLLVGPLLAGPLLAATILGVTSLEAFAEPLNAPTPGGSVQLADRGHGKSHNYNYDYRRDQRYRYQDQQRWNVRPYAPAPSYHVARRHHGYGPYRRDADSRQWLGFTALPLAYMAGLNEGQLRAHEAAQIRATNAPLGQAVVWNQGGAYGNVVALRDGTSTTGRYCREFQQTVTIGGRMQQAYGTACLQPDGAWELVSLAN